ncbi:Hypothetical predicted protein [Pelobates cultripes]|uniref:MKRN2 opposite strand protein n=1 Tax=Pelobates cultripes TaxID=61616 RepID=A0AAD1SWW6_PELCU|nr:Hypothetical predicted protein [Pelobates cultripes]
MLIGAAQHFPVHGLAEIVKIDDGSGTSRAGDPGSSLEPLYRAGPGRECNMQPLEKGVLKFSHCGRDIYCSLIPELCPVCGQSAVNSWKLEDAPVSIPSPFLNGHWEKCSFVLKPTAGLFGEYDGCSDLHVGISSTSGFVFHYNETGIHRDDLGWEQCVSVPLVPPDNYVLFNQWDCYLQEFASLDKWLSLSPF